MKNKKIKVPKNYTPKECSKCGNHKFIEKMGGWVCSKCRIFIARVSKKLTMNKKLEPQRYAPKGFHWQCGACGKISPYDLYGDKKTDWGWDESCVLNAGLIADIKAETKKSRKQSK